jgi:hypothetical protein
MTKGAHVIEINDVGIAIVRELNPVSHKPASWLPYNKTVGILRYSTVTYFTITAPQPERIEWIAAWIVSHLWRSDLN